MLETNAGQVALVVRHTTGTTPHGVTVDFSALAPNDRTSYFYRGEDSAAVKVVLWSDGGATFTGDVDLAATKKLYLDGGSNTYLHERSADRPELKA